MISEDSSLPRTEEGCYTNGVIASTPRDYNSEMAECRNIKVLICVTGSVAAIKIPDLIKEFNRISKESKLSSSGFNFELRIALSSFAQHFVTIDQIKKVDESIKCFTDSDEWNSWSKKGDPVLHIELRKWADVLLFAPLGCNSLAKLANGICDNLVTCVARAWEIGKKPFIVAPAMNTLMWEHPFTLKQLGILQNELTVHVIDPISKLLACGDTGKGAMASVETIVSELISKL
ncbi:hypothetical protein ABK040_005650 [Willaertia magna]